MELVKGVKVYKNTEAKHDVPPDEMPIDCPRTIRVKGDGNCFFRAIALVVCGNQEEHALFRRLVASFMLSNAVLLHRVCTSVEQHLETSKMASETVWATDIEIHAAATMLQTPIMVYSKYGSCFKWLKFAPLNNAFSHADESVYLVNASDHYEPIKAHV